MPAHSGLLFCGEFSLVRSAWWTPSRKSLVCGVPNHPVLEPIDGVAETGRNAPGMRPKQPGIAAQALNRRAVLDPSVVWNRGH